MALVKCPDCGRDVSTEAKACPGCGRPIASDLLYADPERIVGASFLGFLAPLRSLFLFLVVSVSAVTVFWKGPEWVKDNVIIWVSTARVLGELVLVPAAIVMVFFRRTRFLGGALISQAGYLVGAHLWVMSLVYLWASSSFFAILGLLLGIVPVIPFAVVACFLRGDSGSGWTLVLVILEVVVAIGLGFLIVQRDVARREAAAARIADAMMLGSVSQGTDVGQP